MTNYFYGTNVGATGGSLTSGEVLGKIVYADGSFQSFAYNQLGETVKQVDRNGAIHTYEFDAIGRLKSDIASSLTGLDTTIDRHVYSYDTLGNLTYAASKNGSVTKNAVVRQYNGLGQLWKEWQNHENDVSGSNGGTGTPSGNPTITYGYTLANNSSRLTSVTYPSGYVITYGYSGLDDEIGRVTSVSANSTEVENYGYLGLARILNRTRPDQRQSDLVTTLDDLGRIKNIRWKAGDATSPADSFSYLYDLNNNVILRQNLTDRTLNTSRPNLDEVYVYNNLNVQKEFARGSAATSDLYQKTWDVDTQGNRYNGKYSSTYNNANQNIAGGVLENF